MVKPHHIMGLLLLVSALGCRTTGIPAQSSLQSGSSGNAYLCLQDGKCIKLWKYEPQEDRNTMWFETKDNRQDVHPWAFQIDSDKMTLSGGGQTETYVIAPETDGHHFKISRNLGNGQRWLQWKGQPIWSESKDNGSIHHFADNNGSLVSLNLGTGPIVVPPPPTNPDIVPPPPIDGQTIRVCYVADVFGNTVNPYKCVTPNGQIKDWNDNGTDPIDLPLSNLSTFGVKLGGKVYALAPVRIQMTTGATGPSDKRSGFVIRDASGENCIVATPDFTLSRDAAKGDQCGVFQIFIGSNSSTAFTESHYNAYYGSLSGLDLVPCDSARSFAGFPTCVLPSSFTACVRPSQYCPAIICDENGRTRFCGINQYCKAENTGTADSCQPL
jgi:hypothetical protein